MSGFSDAWLALREPADHRARSRAIEETLARHLAAEPVQRIVDLGAGTGSNLRALAPRLGMEQHWLLVDHDAALADAARRRLAAFADVVEAGAGRLVLRLGPRRITVAFLAADLAADPAAALGGAPHLVTAAALYDLVSAAWCRRLAVAAGGALVHAALTCDGRDAWAPPDPDDVAILAAFRAHQKRDKGFGPATGPEATGFLADALASAGYRVKTADSPWRLGAEARPLIAALADGMALAAVETGIPAQAAARWRTARARATHVTIGHQDLLAVPAGR